MGSIRPLITIAILGAVGVFLYMKINEGPAPSKAGATAEAPAGIPPLTGAKGASLATDTAAPAWPTAPPPLAAPATASAAGPATLNAPSTGSTASAANTKDGLPAVPAIPELPPLPTMNDAPPAAAPPTAALPKDLPANSPTSRYGDQAGPTLGGAITDPGKTTETSAAPPLSVAPLAINPPPSTSPSPAPATTNNVPALTVPVSPAASPTAPPAQTSAQNPLRNTPSTTPPAADPNDRYGSAAATAAAVPATQMATTALAAPTTPTTPITPSDATSFTAAWPAIQAALDRHDLKQAHQLLSKWHGNESLSPTDSQKVETLLGQLAGTVIYSTEHQLEPARVVKAGETLETIAKEYNVPSQLLAKINGIHSPDQLRPGQSLKVVRGPFAAVVDLSRNELTLTVDERYAGKFRVMVPPGTTLADGQWLVDQKLGGSAGATSPSAYATTPAATDRSIILRSAAATSSVAPTLIISSSLAPTGIAATPASIRISPQDAEEVSDILSIGSRVVIRK